MNDVVIQTTVRLHGTTKHYRVLKDGDGYVLQKRRHNSRVWTEIAKSKTLKTLMVREIK